MRFSYCLFFCLFFIATSAVGQVNFDIEKFRGANSAERDRQLLDFNFEKQDSAGLAALFSQLENIANDAKDKKSQFQIRYSKFISRRILKTPPEKTLAELVDLQAFAEKNNFRAELLLVSVYRIFEEFDQKKIPLEETYVQLLKAGSEMEEIGYLAFRDYRPDYLLRYIGRFFYDLDDHEQALKFLQQAENSMQFTPDRARNCFLILNTIQTIYQKEKDFEKGVLYAKKILDLTEKLPNEPAAISELKNLWMGIATVDMASMFVEQQKFAEGEVLADKGYQMVLTRTANAASQAEYDVLQVLIPIKLGLKKMGEAQKLLQRTKELNQTLDLDPKANPFKHIRFYESCAKFHEMTGNPAEALRFFKMSKSLADSLEHHNDARKLEKLKQRQDAEKYATQIRLVESERKFQTLLRNAAFLILLLVAGLAFVNFRRLQAQRKLELAELEAARQDLATFTQGFREKSELAENLRNEMENLANRGERSQYLEQLTNSTILTDEDWVNFRGVFEKVHPDFIAEQKRLFPDLTQAEVRYLVLEKLDLNTHEMANMLGVSDGTIRQTRSRLRKKTGG